MILLFGTPQTTRSETYFTLDSPLHCFVTLFRVFRYYIIFGSFADFFAES